MRRKGDLKAYRYITGVDDATFCHRITDLLNRGWDLAGVPTLTFDTAQKRVICGQTLFKDCPETEYSKDVDLDEL